MRSYCKSSLSSKGINYLKFLYVSTIILALSSFFMIASTTPRADAQKTSNSTELDTLFESAETLFNQKKYDEAIPYYDNS